MSFLTLISAFGCDFSMVLEITTCSKVPENSLKNIHGGVQLWVEFRTACMELYKKVDSAKDVFRNLFSF